MSPRSAALVLFVSTALLLSAASAFNITRLLDQYPNFSQFNSLLSQTHLSDEINRRRTITVLAVTNDRVGALAGKSLDVIQRILSTHVVLDYFDTLKLNKLKGNRTVITTLYQATGTADDRQGFLHVAHNDDGSIFFGSAMAGAPTDSRLEGSVAAQPYNISVLSVSHPIIAPGIDGTLPPPPPPAAAAPPKVPPPPPAESPVDDIPADAPVADAPAGADDDAVADAPASVEAPADAPADADGDVADSQSPPAKNAAGQKMGYGVSIIGLIGALVSLWV